VQRSSHIITTNEPTTNFLQARCPSCCPNNSFKAQSRNKRRRTRRLAKCKQIMRRHLCHKKLSQGWQHGQACRTFLTSSLIAMQNMLLCVGAHRSQNFVGCWSPRSLGIVSDPVETCPSPHLVPWLRNSQEIFFYSKHNPSVAQNAKN